MINDTEKLNEIHACWNGVEILRGKIQRSAFTSVGVIGGIFPFVATNAAHNLPFLHALSVLNEVLEAFSNEGHFECRSHFLGALVGAARDALDWNDYDVILEAVSKRNDVAHRGSLVPRGDCWRYIDAVKTELTGWGVIETG